MMASMTVASDGQGAAAASRQAAANPNELLDRLGVRARVDPEPLAHNGWLTPGIWKVHTPEGAAVLKHLSSHRPRGQTPWEAHWSAGDHDPHRWNHWAREALVYRDRLFDAYAGSGLVAPEPLAVEVSDADAVLLLSWEAGRAAEDWGAADYAPVARALGRAQGPYLVDKALPDPGWLSQGFDLFLPARSLPLLETVIFEAYVTGLRESGWDDDVRLVRLGMWSSAVKYDWLGPATVIGAQTYEHLGYGGVERVDPVYKLSARAAGLVFLADWAEKALGLAEVLGL